jgi:hypothetical protein
VTPTMSMQRLDQCQPTANRTVEAAKRKAEGADPTAAETGLGAGASAADATETAETARTASTARAVDPTPAISVGGEKDDPAAAALLCGGGGERENNSRVGFGGGESRGAGSIYRPSWVWSGGDEFGWNFRGFFPLCHVVIELWMVGLSWKFWEEEEQGAHVSTVLPSKKGYH